MLRLRSSTPEVCTYEFVLSTYLFPPQILPLSFSAYLLPLPSSSFSTRWLCLKSPPLHWRVLLLVRHWICSGYRLLLLDWMPHHHNHNIAQDYFWVMFEEDAYMIGRTWRNVVEPMNCQSMLSE